MMLEISSSEAPAAARGPATGTTSVWMGTAPLSSPEPLQGDHTADVCVVGAGIAGLTVAYLLMREGRRVIVVDDGPIAGGESARTTAHLSNVLDARYLALERWHGADRTPLIAESHGRAIERIESIVNRERIACDFARLDAYLFAAEGDEPADLERERAAALRAGLTVEWVSRAPLLPFDTGRCLRFPNQAQFHPLRYLAGLAAAIRREGGRIFASHATRIGGAPPRAVVETTSGHTVAATDVVVATNSPVNDRITMHTKQGPYRTYVVAGRIAAGSIPRALYWDTADPYHYVRLQPEDDEHDLLIVGGEDHHTGQADDANARYERLESWARERFGTFGSTAYRWSGQIIASIDGIGFIGRNPGEQHVFIATGDSGNGMTHGTIAGMLIADLIAGRPNRWASLYDPARITPGAALEFTKENLHVAAGYARWIALGRRKSVEDIAPLCGAVVQRGFRTVAAYRDEHGTLHERSAVCPHLGGLVVWNEGEKSWDCPCHGSRFDAFGRVINGPANNDLAESS
jgi:glycine/D-amino acid oxidase-like deaminating enzyme/nitrite reductase/ring-hydroxylating ferredoxin subunit